MRRRSTSLSGYAENSADAIRKYTYIKEIALKDIMAGFAVLTIIVGIAAGIRLMWTNDIGGQKMSTKLNLLFWIYSITAVVLLSYLVGDDL